MIRWMYIGVLVYNVSKKWRKPVLFFFTQTLHHLSNLLTSFSHSFPCFSPCFCTLCQGKPVMIITEYMENGSLDSFLRVCKHVPVCSCYFAVVLLRLAEPPREPKLNFTDFSPSPCFSSLETETWWSVHHYSAGGDSAWHSSWHDLLGWSGVRPPGLGCQECSGQQ